MESKRPTDKDLQEKALYDIVQYLPLDKLSIKNYNNIDNIVEKAQIEYKLLGKSEQKAIEENLPAIKAIIKDRPELGKAKISNMSWQDNNDDGNNDHNPKGMQACTFERDDQVYISFRRIPRKS